MKIYLGTDHAGFELKEKLKPFLAELGHEVEDLGSFSFDKNDDYQTLQLKSLIKHLRTMKVLE